MRETKPDGRQTMRCERSELDEEFGEISVVAEADQSVLWGFISSAQTMHGRRTASFNQNQDKDRRGPRKPNT